jgi:tetratricopeptide (TPR) repeat protein
MLTTTKCHLRYFLTVMLAGLVGLIGCMPAGPRALLEGEAALRAGQYRLAISKLRVASDLLPQEPRAWNYLGLAFQKNGQLDAAIRSYQQAINQDRSFTAARFNLGCLYAEQGNYAAAIQEFTAFLLAEPGSAQGWLQLGLAQLHSRQFAPAETTLSKALQLNAALAEAWNGLGLIRCQRGGFRDATNYFNAAIRYDPKFAAPLLNQAIVLHQYLKNRPLALQKYREYLTLAPPSETRSQVQDWVAQLDQELNPPPRVVTEVAGSAPTMPLAVTQELRTTTQALVSALTPAPPSVISRTNVEGQPKPVVELPRTSPPPAVVSRTPAAAPKTNLSAAVTPTVEPPPIAERKPVAVLATNIVARAPEAKPESNGTLPNNAMTALSAPPVSAPPASAPLPATNTAVAPEPPRKPVEPPPVAGEAAALASRLGLPRYPYHRVMLLAAGDRGKAEALFQTAAEEQKAGRIAASIEYYRKTVQADPAYFEAYKNLGIQAYQANDLPLALWAYERALIVNPVAADTRYQFALTLQQANYLADAAVELEKVIAASPQDARPQLVLANLYAQQLQQPLLARLHYEQVLKLDPQHPQAAAIRRWLALNP